MKTKIPTDEFTYCAFLQGEDPSSSGERPQILTTRQQCINMPDFPILLITVPRSSFVFPNYSPTLTVRRQLCPQAEARPEPYLSQDG